MSVKIYRTVRNGSLNTIIKYQGGIRRIAFTANFNERGTFSTADAELQKSLEADTGFDTVYVLLRECSKDAPSKRRKGANTAHTLPAEPAAGKTT
ncbi:MAG: hypothetical protein LBF81_03695 [Prevotellaceae bacterium]|jgi:hypothetical protein|nr:hypothetical protein [Prevotellaceae bacterium]